MVSSCCICSKVENPLYLERLFHKIPANEEMRQKWFGVIGQTINYKGAKVCSDHFVENDYHEIYARRKIKRLKSTAVPIPHDSIQQQEQDKNIEEESISMLDASVNTEESYINSISNKSKIWEEESILDANYGIKDNSINNSLNTINSVQCNTRR